VQRQQMNQIMNELRAQELLLCGVHYMMFPFELAFTIVARLLVILRMQSLALHNSPWQRTLMLAWRLCLAAVVLGNLIGISGNFAAAACATSIPLSCAQFL